MNHMRHVAMKVDELVNKYIWNGICEEIWKAILV